MNAGGDEQRWRQRGQQPAQRSQGGGQRRNNNPGGNPNSNGNVWQGPNQQQQQHQHQQQQQQQAAQAYIDAHVPVRGFNGKEVEDFLFRAYEKEMQAAKNTGVDQSQKPMIYKSDKDKGWSTPKNAWGTRANAMASGGNFLTQLKKSQAALQNTPRD
ncbi:uncharacterized protein H6S33_009260 [Morchella sextelata]|uniref:uncharacterized protein n=1 Tax=Morchella sextelata TaxID=1174677 RepID=UPI001D055C12|nr:uncharacterized protein H6S33_009260 [Morchella sextelata]KAH0612880.1 hypothetical protein H6S33_009260 [Morchella sextelata]